MHRIFPIAAIMLSGLLVTAAVAQTEVPAEQRDLPPVAAPTDRVDVAPIQVVRSVSEQIDDFAAGLIEGAASLAHVPGVALVVVRDDHIVVQRKFGSFAPDVAFDAGTLSDLFLAVAAMREIEQGRLAPGDDVSKPLGEAGPRGITVGQLLTHQAGDAALLARLVEKTAGGSSQQTIAADIIQPLLMTGSRADDTGIRTSAADIAHLMIALANGGVYETGMLLQPATVDTMERTQFTRHPALAGWTYGFAEMRRNGWRALVHEGASQGFQSRVVLVPEAKLGYVLVVQGKVGPAFWSTVDNALFDRAFAPRSDADAGGSNMPAPSVTDARAVSGYYETQEDYASSFTAFKRGAQRIRVRARDDGSLLVSGSENAVLSPHSGAYWASADGNLAAALVGKRFVFGEGDFVPLPFWKRPLLYVLAALLLAAAGACGSFYEARGGKRPWRNPGDWVLASASTSVSLLLLSAFVWLLSPAM